MAVSFIAIVGIGLLIVIGIAVVLLFNRKD
jgi:hypothetical protein